MRAQTGEVELGARAVVDAPRIAALHTADPTATGTQVDLHAHVMQARSISDALSYVPGALVQSTGGVGAHASVALRGAETEQTLVLLDDIPLVAPDGGAFDLGMYPAELFERVEVFRGGAPVWYGSGAIGGVLRLMPRQSDPPGYSVHAGAGSFGTWQVGAGESIGAGDGPQLRAHGALRGTTNDYPYLDDQGTRFEATDDTELRRKNAQLMDGSALLDLALPALGGRLHAIALAHGRTAGEPGPGAQPTPNIHRQRVQGLFGLTYERSWLGAAQRPGRLQLSAAGTYARDHYTDLFGELGTSRRWNTEDDAFRVFLRAALEMPVTRWLDASVVGSTALDHHDGSDTFTFPAPAPSTRNNAALAFEVAAHGNLGPLALELRPSFRVEWTRTQLHAERGLNGPFDATAERVVPTARVGAAAGLGRGLAITASVATGLRWPTMFELFGDRGLVRAAPELQPVTSVTYDAGATFRRRTGPLRVALELHGFLQRRRHEIAAQRTAQYQLVHVNSAQVQQHGVEFGVTGWLLETLSLHGGATYLRSQDALGKRLPLRPRWNVSGSLEARAPLQLDAALSSAGVAMQVIHRSFTFADRANLGVIPACTKLALAATLGTWAERVSLAARLDDLTAQRCTDQIGYPLPGRSLFVSLTYREDLP